MNRKILQGISLVIMFFMTQVPKIALNFMYSYSNDGMVQVYLAEYVLTVIAWMLFIIYTVFKLPEIFAKKPENNNK